MLVAMGQGLGVEPPFPEVEAGSATWGLRRLGGLLDASLLLYAGLLHRWGSPLAVVREGPPRPRAAPAGGSHPPVLSLADRWLRRSKRV